MKAQKNTIHYVIVNDDQYLLFTPPPPFTIRQSVEVDDQGMRAKKDLGFLIVIIGGPMTTTTINPHHISRALVTGHNVNRTKSRM